MQQARLPGTDAKCKCDLPVRDATMCACVAVWRSGVASGTHAQKAFLHALMPCSDHDPSGPPMEHHDAAPKKKRGPVDKLWHGLLKACSRSKKQQKQQPQMSQQPGRLQAGPAGSVWSSAVAAAGGDTVPLSTSAPPDHRPRGPQSWDPHVRNGWLESREETRWV